MKYFIGIDIGSTCTKTVVLDEQKQLVKSLLLPTGWSSVDTAETVKKTLAAEGFHIEHCPVVATGYAFSEAAGDFATMVKLTRTLSIIPTVLVFAFINLWLKRKEAKAIGADESELHANFSIRKIFPWFIVAFVLMSVIASILTIPSAVLVHTKSASKFLMVSALAAIGLNTSFSSMKKSGVRPMLHGFIISALVVVVALVVEIAMGIVTF